MEEGNGIKAFPIRTKKRKADEEAGCRQGARVGQRIIPRPTDQDTVVLILGSEVGFVDCEHKATVI